MIALQINDIAAFMNMFLKGQMFDHFLLQEATITREISYTIDGALRPDYFTAEEIEEMGLDGCAFLPFSHVRPFCLELMKGKKRPGYFKFVFLLSPQNQENTIRRSGSSFHTEDISAMYLNLIYRNDTLTCTTGISYRLFSPDRSLEQEWDRLAGVFLKQNGIKAEPAT